MWLQSLPWSCSSLPAEAADQVSVGFFFFLFFCMMTCSINDLFPVETHLWFDPLFFVSVPPSWASLTHTLSSASPFFPDASVWQQKWLSTRSHTEPAETWFESFRFTLSSEQGRSVYGLIRRSWAAKWTTLVMVQFLHWALLIIQYSGGSHITQYIVQFTTVWHTHYLNNTEFMWSNICATKRRHYTPQGIIIEMP